ncbi:hypothetical protein [uncultured Lutibacter sp.]|uniref:hypothetical protein n=1 Tax=uncultured Lutibacter sp. TaxID=437739 RepID=UPI00261C623E|nr:hypothetical protein [uncultured Lutibacter sp.]
MKILTIVFCFIVTLGFSQKQYDFDYIFEYELNHYKDSIHIPNHHFHKSDKKIRRYYLTNSKSNNYFAVITEKDSLYYNLVFIDHQGIYANVDYLKSDLNIAEFINIDCKNVSKTANPYKYKTRYYDIQHLKDTVIENESFWQYKMISNKQKKKEKGKIGTSIYIIEKFSDFHLPLLTFSTLYEKYILHKELPNGIIKEYLYINYYGKLSEKEMLIKYNKIDKKIILQKECDYTAKLK